MTETIEVREQRISSSDAAIEATAERGRRRLDRSKKRVSDLETVVLKTQQQRDEATEELSAARTEVLNLHQELASTRSHHADATAKSHAEIERLKALVEKLSARSDAEASAPQLR